MRYQNISIERLKAKAKLLKRYISHPVMEAPDLSLTDIQRIIAKGFGFVGWAEFSHEAGDSQGGNTKFLPDAVFKQLAEEFGRAICRSTDLCAALVYRAGFCPDSADLALDPRNLEASERELLVDIVLDRLIEVGDCPTQLAAGRGRLLDLYRELDRERNEDDARSLGSWPKLEGGFSLMDWIRSITTIFSYPGGIDSSDILTNSQKKIRWLPPKRLIAPFAAGEISNTGLFVMTGGTATGRTTSSILLSLCNRGVDKSLFPIFLKAYNDLEDQAKVAGYFGEVTSKDTFRGIFAAASSRLVIVQLASRSPASAYKRTRQIVSHILGPVTDDWLIAHLIGGYHHDFGDRDRVTSLVDSRVSFWSAINARETSAAEGSIVVSNIVDL